MDGFGMNTFLFIHSSLRVHINIVLYRDAPLGSSNAVASAGAATSAAVPSADDIDDGMKVDSESDTTGSNTNGVAAS